MRDWRSESVRREGESWVADPRAWRFQGSGEFSMGGLLYDVAIDSDCNDLPGDEFAAGF